MKTITIQVSDEMHAQYVKNEAQLKDSFEILVKQELSPESLDRLLQVKIICRAKAPVCNWYDMEMQILKGSL